MTPQDDRKLPQADDLIGELRDALAHLLVELRAAAPGLRGVDRTIVAWAETLIDRVDGAHGKR